MAVQVTQEFSPPLKLPGVPTHAAIIMDGNGRWAGERGLPRLAGHRAGTEKVRQVIQRFADYDVKYLTLYAFSTENWNRPRAEVAGLMGILRRVIQRELPELHKNGIRLRHIGRLDKLSTDLQREVLEAIDFTKDNKRLTLNLAFNYGGRTEIVDAVRRIVEDGIPPECIDEALFQSYLYTEDLPDPDLIIRTAGEMRVSNFLLWQAAYAEFYATPVYWPDFDCFEVDKALLAYSQRRRRFGGLEAENGSSKQPANGYHYT
jgi:undecaprenyl diphosphate synthase